MAITGIARGPANFMKVHVSFLTYWAIVGITYAFEHYRKYRERELQAAHLQTALARAQVQSLQMQLHPHFLFNTLNAIAALMRENVEAADVMIARLGDLLRVTLATADVPEVPLRRELELVDMYLDIQRARMGDRLTSAVSAEPQTLDVQVPTLLSAAARRECHPPWRGARPGPTSIEVRARRDGDLLVIDVEDDGPGPPESIAPATASRTRGCAWPPRTGRRQRRCRAPARRRCHLAREAARHPMTPLRVLIVDDEPLARRRLRPC